MSQLHDRTLQTMYLPNGGDPEQMNESRLQQPGMLGGRLIQASALQGNKEYQLVQVDSNSTNTPAGTVYGGSMALWSDRNTYKVGTAVSVLGRGNVAGMFVNAITPGNYGMIQIAGRTTILKYVDAPTAAPSAAGLFVIPSATNGKFDCLAAGSSATYPVVGRSASTINAGDQTGTVDLNVYETF